MSSNLAGATGAVTGVDARTMPVVEKFVSVNGEGRFAGKLAAFVRFAGCNLACSYCDTIWANVPGVEVEPMTVGEIVDFVREMGVRHVTLTGGEPALQPLLPDLVRALMEVRMPGAEGEEPYELQVEIETNGAVDLQKLAQARRLGVARPGNVAFTMDYKCPSSGMEDAMVASNFGLLEENDTVKFVLGSQADLERMLAVVRGYDLCARCAVYLSPVFGKLDPADIVAFMREHALTRATVQVQLHKIIWPNVEKGV